MMSYDIVARLREEGFVTHMLRLTRESKLLHEAADEIERLRELSGDAGKLRKELHKARCIACDIYARRSMKNYLKRAISFSKEMGWDCFKEDTDEH